MDRPAPLFTPVLLVGCLIILVSFAVRASFGVFQIPIAADFGWLRSAFSLAIAIQ
ncbi:MFS transporter, partial [Tritonibacter sp. SIMBA_163]